MANICYRGPLSLCHKSFRSYLRLDWIASSWNAADLDRRGGLWSLLVFRLETEAAVSPDIVQRADI